VASNISNPISIKLRAVKGDWKVGNGQASALALLSVSGLEQWASWTTALTKRSISYVLMISI